MQNNKIKAVVVGGWMDKDGKSRMIQLIGAFENIAEAYGKAYLYLDSLATGNQSISTAQTLEGDSGYALFLQDKDGATDYAYVLFDLSKENEGGDAT